MTNPTLERAARAVSETMASVPAKAMNNTEWIDFERKIARAVLMAVRDDPPLIKVGFFPYGGMYDIGRIARDGWEAMIDSIIGENDDKA